MTIWCRVICRIPFSFLGGVKAFLIYSLPFSCSMRKSSENHIWWVCVRVKLQCKFLFILFYTFLLCTHVQKRTHRENEREREKTQTDRQIHTSTTSIRFYSVKLFDTKEYISWQNTNHFLCADRVFVSFQFFFGLLDIYRILSFFLAFFVCLHTHTPFAECNKFYFKIVC